MVIRRKYNVGVNEKSKAKRTFEGILFASEIEMKYYRDYLLPLQFREEVIEIVRLPKFMVSPKFTKYGNNYRAIYYEADFKVTWRSGKIEIVDVKGLATEAAKLKRKLFDYQYPNETLKWISFSKRDGGWIDYDRLEELKRLRKKDKKK